MSTATSVADIQPDETSELVTSELAIGGMHCASCAQRVQRSLRDVPAVASAAVNLATERAYVTFDPAGTTTDDLCHAVVDGGYSAEPVSLGTLAVDEPIDREGWRWRAIASWPLALAALFVALLAPETATSGWVVLLLGVTVQIVGGWPFMRTSFRLLRHGATSMDTLITLGTLAALAVSAVEAIALGGRHVHLGGSGAFAARLHGAMAPLIICRPRHRSSRRGPGPDPRRSGAALPGRPQPADGAARPGPRTRTMRTGSSRPRRSRSGLRCGSCPERRSRWTARSSWAGPRWTSRC